MTVRVTKIDDETGGCTILRVEGSLHLGETEIVERVFEEFHNPGNRKIEIDLSAVSFIDSEGATVLKRIERRGARLTNLDFFIRQVIEACEAGNLNDRQ